MRIIVSEGLALAGVLLVLVLWSIIGHAILD